MAKLHIKKGDTVIVLSGDDKGVRVHAEISYKEKDGKQKKVVTRVCAKCGHKFD